MLAIVLGLQLTGIEWVSCLAGILAFQFLFPRLVVWVIEYWIQGETKGTRK